MEPHSTSQQRSKPNEKILRVKKPFYRKASSRRVSCKDLGNGECEGWLWKKKEKTGFISRDWKKFWFTLKEKSLYYYKNKDDEMAQGIFQMPAFTVSPVCDKDSSRKFAFKACHQKFGTFLFASERKDDMVKWMNKLQIACLPDVSPHQNVLDTVTDDYSGSESEDDSLTSSLPSPIAETTSLASSDISITTLAQINSFEEDSEDRPKSESGLIAMTIRPSAKAIFERSVKHKSKPDTLQRLCNHLGSLQRTLKDKEKQLCVLEDLLDTSSPITSESFQKFNSPLVTEILNSTPEEKNDECTTKI